MAKLTIRKERCKSCGLCIGVCPKKILALDESILNEKGFHPVMITDEGSSIGCAM